MSDNIPTVILETSKLASPLRNAFAEFLRSNPSPNQIVDWATKHRLYVRFDLVNREDVYHD